MALSWIQAVTLRRDVDSIFLLCSAIAAQAAADVTSRATCEICGGPLCSCAATFLEHLQSLPPTDPAAIALDMLRIAGA